MMKATVFVLLALAGTATAQSLPPPRWVESPLVGQWEPTSASTKDGTGTFDFVLSPEAFVSFRPDGLYAERHDTTRATPGFIPSAASEEMQRAGRWRAKGHRVVIDATSKAQGRVVITCEWKIAGDELTLIALGWKVYGKDRVAVEEDFGSSALAERTVRYQRVAKLTK